jgi:hypothetical protein
MAVRQTSRLDDLMLSGFNRRRKQKISNILKCGLVPVSVIMNPPLVAITDHRRIFLLSCSFGRVCSLYLPVKYQIINYTKFSWFQFDSSHLDSQFHTGFEPAVQHLVWQWQSASSCLKQTGSFRAIDRPMVQRWA